MVTDRRARGDSGGTSDMPKLDSGAELWGKGEDYHADTTHFSWLI